MRTILKILVVLGIFGLGAALLLPKICHLREAAFRIKCANNVKQLAMAAVNYTDTYKAFPAGTWSEGDWPPEKRFSWLFAMAPYIESNPIYSRAKRKLPWDAPANQFLVDEPYRIMLCPGQSTSSIPAVTNYIGMAGVGEDAATLPHDDRRAGMFGYDRMVSLADIKDGASTTMMIIETSANLGPWAAGGPSTVRGLDPAQQPYVELDGQFGLRHLNDFLILKGPVGCNIAFADGSVRYLAASISSQTLEALATIAGDDKPGDY
jgi:prepilin-type processing-associated H-X9-DG protein